jgi:hypothetical protein
MGGESLPVLPWCGPVSQPLRAAANFFGGSLSINKFGGMLHEEKQAN